MLSSDSTRTCRPDGQSAMHALRSPGRIIGHAKGPIFTQAGKTRHAVPCESSRRDVLLSLSSAGPAVQTCTELSGSGGSPLACDSVQQFTLPTGMHFIVYRSTVAPVVSAHIYARVGAWEEAEGATGLAHLGEHLAFKGTRRIGALDWAREAPLLDAMDETFYELRQLQQQQQAAMGSSRSNSAAAARLQDQLQALQSKASGLVEQNAYGKLLSRAGAVGLNATTSHDETRYFVSLPANKLELWFALESERFRAPVFRELYAEKKVIEEERRLRVDDAPVGRFQAEFALRSLGNQYRRPVIGFADDFQQLGRVEVADFFAKYYGPQRLTVALAGDVTVEQVQQLANKYFGDWSGAQGLPRPAPPPATQDPPPPAASPASPPDAAGGAWRQQQRLRNPLASIGLGQRYEEAAAAGPLLLLGFYRPALTSREGTVIQVISDLLTGGRTAQLVQRLVLGQRSLLGCSMLAGWPGEARAGLSLVSAVPQQGGSVGAAEKLVWRELERFAAEGPTAKELARVQKSTRTSLLSAALSNSSMASLLASYHGLTGSWTGLLAELEVISQLTPGEVRDVAQRLFRRDNVFTGVVNKAR
ncbi:peptidase M16 inactive domain family [Haematococcus lacustris]